MEQYVTNKMTDAQLFAYRGDWLFTEVMTDQVYFLTEKYCVQYKKFRNLLWRVGKCQASVEDAEMIMELHHVLNRSDSTFKKSIEDHEKTMWLFTNNDDVRKKNVDKHVKTSKDKKVPVARLDCSYNTKKL